MISRSLQALLLYEMMDVAFVLLIDFLEAVELLLLELAEAWFLAERVVLGSTEIFRPEPSISHLERIVATKVFVGVWNSFIQIFVNEPGVFLFLLFLSFCVLLQKEVLLKHLFVKS